MKFYSRGIKFVLLRSRWLMRIIQKLSYLGNLDQPDIQISNNQANIMHSFDLHRRVVEISKFLRIEKLLNDGLIFKRFGNLFDGGYVMVKDFSDTDCLITLGVGSDISCDAEIAKEISKVHFYDHTVSSLPESVPNSTHFREKIGYGDSKEVSLEETLKRIQASGEIVLKMDIEGSEWEVLKKTTSLSSFKQIVIELHGLHQIIDLNRFVEMSLALAKIHKSHGPVHIHANNYAPVTIVGNSFLPDVIEVTYLSRSKYNLSNFDFAAGTDFDSPNNSSAPEIALTFPLSTRFNRI